MADGGWQPGWWDTQYYAFTLHASTSAHFPIGRVSQREGRPSFIFPFPCVWRHARHCVARVMGWAGLLG